MADASRPIIAKRKYERRSCRQQGSVADYYSASPSWCFQLDSYRGFMPGGLWRQRDTAVLSAVMYARLYPINDPRRSIFK